MLNANRLPPFQWRKKKGQLIPTSFFLKSTPKATTLETKSGAKVEENQANYTTTAEEEKKAATQEIQALKEVVTPPTPKINITPPQGKKVSSFSLASIQKKKEWEQKQKTEATEEEHLPEEAFSQTELNQYWKKYQEEKTRKREQNLASLFQLNEPVLLENFQIEYTVPSPLNKVELEREFVFFLPYLRNALNNFSIQIKVVVKAGEEKNYIYTPEEKYNRLREINPQLDDLRKELDLDL